MSFLSEIIKNNLNNNVTHWIDTCTRMLGNSNSETIEEKNYNFEGD